MRQPAQIVDELVHVVVATRHTIAFAMTAAIEGHATTTQRCQRCGRAAPGAARLTKAMREQQGWAARRVAHFDRQPETVSGSDTCHDLLERRH